MSWLVVTRAGFSVVPSLLHCPSAVPLHSSDVDKKSVLSHSNNNLSRLGDERTVFCAILGRNGRGCCYKVLISIRSKRNKKRCTINRHEALPVCARSGSINICMHADRMFMTALPSWVSSGRICSYDCRLRGSCSFAFALGRMETVGLYTSCTASVHR